MTKNILAIAIAAAVAAPSAFAAATVYGIAHVGIAQQTDVAANAAATSQTSVFSNSSRLGIKGSEDLSAGMKAVYQVEMQVNMDGEGSPLNGGSNLRNTFAGVAGGFGTVLLGRHDSPIKMVGRTYDLFGDQIGNNRNILGGTTASTLVDGRHSNVIAYATPTMGGLSAMVALVPGAGQDNEYYSNDAVKKDAWSAMIGYKAGAFGVSAGYINVDNVYTGKAFTATRVGGEYSFGAAKVVALYQTAQATATTTNDVYGIGGQYAIGQGAIKAQYYAAGNTAAAGAAKNGASLTTIGYDHNLSKNTTAYAAYSLVDNDAAGAFTANMANGGSGDNTTAIAGKDNSAFSVGLIHKF